MFIVDIRKVLEHLRSDRSPSALDHFVRGFLSGRLHVVDLIRDLPGLLFLQVLVVLLERMHFISALGLELGLLVLKLLILLDPLLTDCIEFALS